MNGCLRRDVNVVVQVSGLAHSRVMRDSLTMRARGATVLWGSAAQSALKARVLVKLLAHPARSYDVSVPGQPVTTPR